MFSSNCCLSGERNIRDAPVNSSVTAVVPTKDTGKQEIVPNEKKGETQPAGKEKEEKSTSTLSKNTEQNTFLVRMRTCSHVRR